MPNIQKVTLKAKEIQGLKVRTKNNDEMEQKSQKIAPLWGRFYAEILPSLEKNSILYGVYYNYESDAMGEFDVLVGSENLSLKSKLKSLELKEGKYLMFPVKGELPQAIVDTWKKVWAYFEDPSIDERRAYETDFEKYISEDEAEIYIGVHYY